jgi:SP family arabinose:H+ symporter-like MFS transporter
MEDRATRGGGLQYVSRLNVMIAGAAAKTGIIYGYDLGSIATAIHFGYGSLVWVYASESFPARLRTQGAQPC